MGVLVVMLPGSYYIQKQQKKDLIPVWIGCGEMEFLHCFVLFRSIVVLCVP